MSAREANSVNSLKKPVLFLHGMGSSSTYFVSSGPGLNSTEQDPSNPESTKWTVKGKAVPYQMVDTDEYDVWLLNQRGNYYSRQHNYFDPDTQPEFWNFSFE